MKVYHFLPTVYGLLALKHRRLKIARLHELNDPFELIAANQSNREHRPIWAAWHKQQIETWGMVCFSKTWKNPVLWSHYANKHKGMCLGFEIPDEHLIQVKYSKTRLDIDLVKLYDDGKLTKEHMQRVFKTKFAGWSYEREARVYAKLDKCDEETGFYFHSFDDQLKLTDVIAGPLFDSSKSVIDENVQDEDRNARIFKARLAFRSFEVVEQQQGF